MVKLTKGQVAVLVLAATPMSVIGAAGAIATFFNMKNVLHRGWSALGVVAAGEGATLIAALVALAVTLMGQHTPTVVRVGMWFVPMLASGAGVALAPTKTEMVVMGLTPLAMTAAGEGVTFVARRIVAYRTNVDIEQQRRSGLLLWHANRAANGSGFGKRVSKAAVWRLTKQFAATDDQLSVQLGAIQRFHISQGADENLAAILTRAGMRPSLPLADAPAGLPPRDPRRALDEAVAALDNPTLKPDRVSIDGEVYEVVPVDETMTGDEWIQSVFHEAEDRIPPAPVVNLLTSDDVAEQKNVKPATVRSWVHRGHLRVHDTDDRGRKLFHPDDVAKLP